MGRRESSLLLKFVNSLEEALNFNIDTDLITATLSIAPGFSGQWEAKGSVNVNLFS
jgi:hypothetical protein